VRGHANAGLASGAPLEFTNDRQTACKFQVKSDVKHELFEDASVVSNRQLAHLRDQGRAVPQGGEDTIRLTRD